MHIQVYLCRVSFLTTLNIYKDYFKGRQRWWKGCCNCCCTHIVTKECVLVHLSLEEAAHLYVIGFCDQGACWSSSSGWTEELCNQHLSQFCVLVTYLDPCIDWLVTYWKPCIEMRDCHYIKSPIVYWDKGSTVGWY